MVSPPAPPPQLRYAASFLIRKNGPKVESLIRSGVRDEGELLRHLSDWGEALKDEDDFPILFLGLVLTLDCSFDPKCLYCNQRWLPVTMELEDWKRVIKSVCEPKPPYVYLTGGEPLILGEKVWGDDGIVAFATRLGCAVNVNTNAELITPRVALQMVKIGLSRLHISLDTPDLEIQSALFRGRDRVESVLKGIFNIQIAREVLGANHPLIHINCVLTRWNMFDFPKLLRFILDIREARSDDPSFADFAFHLIPVGGCENDFIRPTAEEWKRFYTETWEEAREVWADYQREIGVPIEKRKPLEGFVPFANPFLRVDHRVSLDEYCEHAASGIYWRTALTERCYVAPTQGFVLPNGLQHWCGAHAIGRPTSIGNVKESPFRENILRNLHRLSELPNRFCYNCAGATCVINQTVERALKEEISKRIHSAG
jgi:MoaA/NifB/PqqE/SkfB family radical SAM enzyme